MERLAFNANTCTGFYQTPSWKCTPVTVPVYLMRAKDQRALVLISHGSQGLDARHAMYARQLVEYGINAVVIGHWEARGLGKIQSDYDAARKRGGDVPNQVLDVLAVATQMKAQPEWSETKFGHLGESLGAGTALGLTRPYLRRAFSDLYGAQPVEWDAIVPLYAGCTEHNTQERFLPYPLMFLHGEEDNDTLASDCQKQVPWMNERGGQASIKILPGQPHDFDATYRLVHVMVQNPAKCSSIRDKDIFKLDATGKQYPGTPEGYAQMRKDCIGMTWGGVWAGNKGDMKTGYAEWTKFLVDNLLPAGS